MRRHYDGLTYGWLRMTAQSDEAKDAVQDVTSDLINLTYG